MLRNYLAAALRNLLRNRLYAGINIAGLAAGFAAAILIGLFVRDEYSFDRFIPDGHRVFLATSVFHEVAGQKYYVDFADPFPVATLLKNDFPQIETVGRLLPESGAFRSRRLEANEHFFWADPDLLKVLRLPAVAGEVEQALEQPDTVVITRRVARKYFGVNAPLGETLQLDRRHAVKVTAVIEDFPATTHLSAEIMISGRSSFSRIHARDAGIRDSSSEDSFYTYVKLKPGADARGMRDALPAFMKKHFPRWPGQTSPPFGLDLVRVTDVHLYPAFDGMHRLKHSIGGSQTIVYALGIIGAMIVLVASINFVNLMTTRTARRATEVGVRKAVGATRGDLMLQFMGESLLCTMLAVVLAMMLVEWLLPAFNAFLKRDIVFDYWRDPKLAGGIAGVALIVGILSGFYPAFVLSSFRPVAALKGSVRDARSNRVRQALVIAQFAVLIMLIISTGVIYRQAMFALHEGVQLRKDRVLLVKTSCRTHFRDEVLKIPGVSAAACAHGYAMHHGWVIRSYMQEDGVETPMFYTSADVGFFELFGLRPLAGRFFSRTAADGSTKEAVVNESAVRRAGFTSASDAIGRTLKDKSNGLLYAIVGVAPDYSTDVLHEPIRPTLYYVDPNEHEWLNLKLTGSQVAQTVAAIDRLWKQTGDPKPIERLFFDRHLRQQSADVSTQARILAVFAGVATFIACLGLFGLSAFTAERRTKEIGIRKAMGASRSDIVKLLIWQFTQPVLWANLIAWPLGYLAMNRWLQSFLSHTALELSIFVAASAAGLSIALLTVSGHAYRVAGNKPVSALRYE